MDPKIKTTGFEILTEEQKSFANNLIAKEYEKISRQLKNEVILTIDIKENSKKKSDKDNKKVKYSISAQAKAPTLRFEASEADWDFNRTLHDVLRKLGKEIEHKFHVSEQGKE